MPFWATHRWDITFRRVAYCTCSQSARCTTEHWRIVNAAPLFPMNCTYYRLGGNKRIASSLLRTNFIIPFSRGNTQRVTVRVSTVRIPPWTSDSHYMVSFNTFALSKTRLMKSWNCGWGWWPPVAETCYETAQRGPTFTTSTASN